MTKGDLETMPAIMVMLACGIKQCVTQKPHQRNGGKKIEVTSDVITRTKQSLEVSKGQLGIGDNWCKTGGANKRHKLAYFCS